MKTAYVCAYLIGAALLLIGMACGSLIDGHLVLSGLPANAAKSGAILGLSGWLIELVYLVKEGKP
jgi:hypothetical protein